MGAVRCGVCSHADRVAIDADLLGVGPNGKLTQAHVCAKYHLGRGQVQRHVGNGHITKVMAAAQAEVTGMHGNGLLLKLAELYEKADSLMGKAEHAGDLRTAVSAIGQARAVIETFAKVGIALAQGPDEHEQVDAGGALDQAIEAQLAKRRLRLEAHNPPDNPDDEVYEAEVVD